MLVKCNVLNKEEFDRSVDFFNSEYKKGNIDLTHPSERPDDYWYSEIEIDVDDEIIDTSNGKVFVKNSDDYYQKFGSTFFSLTDLIFWCNRNKWGIPSDFKTLDRNKKIEELLK
jgi:hypothetical protein